jgi:hypothetical protein
MINGVSAYQQQAYTQQANVAPRDAANTVRSRETLEGARREDRVDFSQPAERARESTKARADERDERRASEILTATSESRVAGKDSAQKRGSLLDVVA